MWDVAKANLEGKCIVLNANTRKEERLKINFLSTWVPSEEDRQNSSKLNQRKEIEWNNKDNSRN